MSGKDAPVALLLDPPAEVAATGVVLQSSSIKAFHRAVLGHEFAGLRRQMWGITSPWIFKSVELAVAAKRLGIEEECTQEHWNDKDEEDGPPGREQRRRVIQRAQCYSRFTVPFERFAIGVMQACKTLSDATRRA